MANKDIVAMVVQKGKLVTITEGGKIREVKEDRKDFSYPRRHRKKKNGR